MALPAEFNTRAVHFAAIGLDGTPLTGSVTFSTTTVLTAPTTHTRIPPKPLQFQITTGEMNGVVPRTDDPDIQPPFLYKVDVKYDGGFPGESFFVSVPDGTGPVELANYAALGAAPAALVGQVLSVAGLTGHITYDQLQALGLGSGTGGSLPAGGTVNQVLVKNSIAQNDASWKALSSALITDFNEAAQDAIAALLQGTSGVSLAYNDTANTLTITGPGVGGSTDPESVRDLIGLALVGVGNIFITVNDAADTITIGTTATVNDTDANLKNRANHTGVQVISTITGLQTALDGKMAAGLAGLPAGVMLHTTALARPTTRPDLHVTFDNPADPGTNALPTDYWDAS